MINKIFEILNKYINTEYKKFNIFIIWLILYFTNQLTWIRIKYFIIIIIIIIIYKMIWIIIEKIIEKNINIKDNWLHIMFQISTKSNIILYGIICLEKSIYKWKLKKFIIKILLSLFIPLKLLLYYIYQISYRLKKYTIYEIIVKRAFGLILSVLIFTNIIQILITELGSRMNLIIFIYLVIVIWNVINQKEYQENKKIQGNLWNLDILKIWEIKTESNMLSYIIKQTWAKKKEIEKLEFLKKYGFKINEVWLKTLQIKSTTIWEIWKKWKIINKKDINFESYDLHLEYEYYRSNINSNQLFLIGTLKELLEYESELEYLKLLYENEKLEIVKEYNVENVNLEELLEYNNTMLKAILYYFWDLKGQNQIKFKIDPENGLELELKEKYELEQHENLTIENYVEKYINKKLSLNMANYRKLYEINLFIDTLVYIKDLEKYEKYINFFKLNNVIIDKAFIRINTIDVTQTQEINKKWQKILENKIQEYYKEYEKDKYLKYFEKL